MSSSLATLSIAHIKKYIDNHIGTDLEFMEQIKNLAKYYPTFFLNATFRVTSATIMILFFRSFSLVLLILYSGLLQRTLNLIGNSKEVQKKMEFRQQEMESLFQSFVTNTNLVNSTAAKICRKATFYFNLVFHILLLIVIYLMCLYGTETENILFWSRIPLAENEIVLTILIFSVISIGLFSILLELGKALKN